MNKIIFIFLMVFTIYQSNKVLAANEAVTVDEVVTFLDKYQKDIGKAVKKISNNKKLEKPTMLKYYFKRIFGKNSDIYQRIPTHEYLLAERQYDFFKYLRRTLPDFSTNKTSKMIIDIFKIHYNFQQYRDFDEKKDTEKTIKAYVNKNIDNVIPKKLSNLYDHIVKSRAGPNLLDRIIELIGNIPEERCDDNGSLQDKFYNFYLSCILTELLATSTMIESYGVKELIKSGSGNKKNLKSLIAESKKRMTEYSKEFTLALAQIPINYRNCDPYGDKNHERGLTYWEMAGLYQYILMYSHHLWHSSCATCENVKLPNGTGNEDCYIQLKESTPWDEDGAPENFKSCTTPRNCYGKIHSCISFWKPEYCMMKNDVRRYKWIRDKYDLDKYSYGDVSSHYSCTDGVYGYREYEYESYAKFAKCPFCWCRCDDTSPNSKLTVNTISLLPAMSSIAKNKVVVGMRMIIKDSILRIQVAEGVIGPNYIIQAHTDEWVGLPNMRIDVQESLANGGTGKLKQNTDYVLWNTEKNGINMDEILLEYGRVVTGVKFGIKKEGKQDERIQIQIHSTKYDWKSGKLLKDNEKWHYPDGEHDIAGFLNLLSPLESNKKTTIDSKTNEFYTFSPSDSKTDAGQTTVPLFDASYVASKVPAALSGIGLHHRSSNRKNGGFFGLTAYSVSYYQYMTELNPET